MVDKQVTTMVLKVDLQCHRCYKKIKKVLCKFPQIQDQVYDEKENTVTIKVICCSPEKIKKKIACKAKDVLKSCIEIKLPDKPSGEKTDPANVEQPDNNTGEAPQKEKPVVIVIEKTTSPPASPPKRCCRECIEGHGGGPCQYGNHGGWTHWPPYYHQPYYYDGYYCGRRPVCEEVFVARYDCPQENYEPCSIM